jgi:Ran GTPase-activating protein (RanGAP) involved in mRNA processing and transport
MVSLRRSTYSRTMANVQALCDKLVANDAALTELEIRLEDVDDAEFKLILDSAKKNKTVKKVLVRGSFRPSSLSVPAALSLASAVSEHPEIQEIQFILLDGIEFGPIALTIRQNRKVTRLLLDRCLVTPNLAERIRWLLTENALESLTLNGNFNEDELSFDISGALLGNSSLKKLVLQDYNEVIGSETFQAIPHMIRTNPDFETLDLLLSFTITDRPELVRLVTQAAEGHASLNKLAIAYPNVYYETLSVQDFINHAGTAYAIGTMLHNAPALRELSLSNCFMGSAGARHLADGLSSTNSVVEKVDLSRNRLSDDEVGNFARVLLANRKLKSLVLRTNNIGDAGAVELAFALRHNITLDVLDLSNNIIGDAGAVELAVALRQNNTLDLLDLGTNRIGSNGASALADDLVGNNALKALDLQSNEVGDDGATSIAEMLTRNESIENVYIGRFGEKGLKAFATRLSSMNGLKTLIVSSYDGRGYTSEIGNSIVLALEQNTTLETFEIYSSSHKLVFMPQVERLLALNRGGRRLLSAMGESVPPLNYWPRILARSSDNADVLFYFLREIHNVLVEKAGSRKRKRGNHETNY